MGGRRFAPRSEPLCFPTHLTPMSYRRPWGGWQTPTEPVCVPGDRDGGPRKLEPHPPSSRHWPGLGSPVEGTGEKMPDSTYKHRILQGHFLQTMRE